MGDQNVSRYQDDASLRRFTRQLLQDVRALEYMLREGRFETGARRIGAEQELFLVDEHFNPMPAIEAVLGASKDERVVSELAKFNLEFNLDPHAFGGTALSQMEAQLHELMAYVRQLARSVGSDVVMCGILPTLHLTDLTVDNLTPMPRYYALHEVINRLRGGAGQFQIRGTDELFVRHEGMLMEMCNTSFQTHFQVDPDTFPLYYNMAQTVAGPVMALSANSPLLFGKDLWRETRIALFQQAVDTRSANLYLREMSPRVHFGSRWIDESVTELYKEDISRFRVLLAPDHDEPDPFDVLDAGGVPRLKALGLHNGTVYRWNRAVYGVSTNAEGVEVPHLRIENRIMPSGPSIPDEMANSAFWFGLVSGMILRYGDIRQHMAFHTAKSNFVNAARLGLGATLTWVDGVRLPAPELILHHLIPIAHEGLMAAGVAASDADRYLGLVEQRVKKGVNGAEWQLASLNRMRHETPGATRSEMLTALVAGMVTRQEAGTPVAEWDLASIAEGRRAPRLDKTRVEHYMTTDLYTVHEDELVDLVASLMDWQHIRHVLVEDEEHRLVGLVSHRSLLRYLVLAPRVEDRFASVKDIMHTDVVTVAPDTLTSDAVRLMREKGIGALPVVRDGQLVGIVTERDFIAIAGQLLDAQMEEGEEGL